ncbi:MAG: ABC transporter ATP-binding protein [Candidatus Zixiibacteriota bacterium]
MSPTTGFHEEETLGKAYDARLIKRLLPYVKPYRLTATAAVAMLLLNAAFQTALAFITRTAIDEYIVPGKGEGFGWIAAAYLGGVILLMASTYGQIMLTMWLGQNVQNDIRMQLFSKLQHLHLGFLDRNPVGRMVTRVTNDVNALNELFASGVVNIIGDLLMIAFFVAALFWVNWRLALVTFISLPLLMVATFIFRARARDAYRSVKLKLARLNSFIQEHVTGMTIVQLFVREHRTFARFDGINRSLRSAHHRSVFYYAVFYPTVELIGALSAGLLLYYGGLQIQNGLLTFGDLVLFIYLVERFFHPIRDLSEKYNVLQASMASSERIFRLLDSKEAIEDPPNPVSMTKETGRIDIENVWFTYHHEDWVLKDVSFSVEPGQKIAIVGATGAGKTSLVSLLFRFYDYQKGSIKLGGRELRRMSQDYLRSHLGLVLQDVFLFAGSIASNVRLRDNRITDDQVISALERVGFSRFLEHMPEGINTPVHERGAGLSTGQKQLLSFARALAFDPEILILDEATSSVDTETERLIQQALSELLVNRTSIIIAHRLSTIEKADKIVVLHHGMVREIGRHEQLLKQRGIYYKLYLMQEKRKELGADALPPAEAAG